MSKENHSNTSATAAKVATLQEIHYLLFDVLDRHESVAWYEVSLSCKEFSINFAFSFEGTVTFLQQLGLVKVHRDRSMARCTDVNYSLLEKEPELAGFILDKLLAPFRQGSEPVSVGPSVELLHNGELVLYPDKLPEPLRFLPELLLNLGIATLSASGDTMLVLQPMYRPYFSRTDWVATVAPAKVTSISTGLKPPAPKLFISYSSKDEEYRNELQKHLSGLKFNGEIDSWDGRAILAGENWDEAIKEKLDQASIVLFLVSSDFMASNYIRDVEIKKAIERYQQGLIKIIPIIVRSCDFDSLPIRLQALPVGAKAVSSWSDRDEAYLNIVTGIKEVLKSLAQKNK